MKNYYLFELLLCSLTLMLTSCTHVIKTPKTAFEGYPPIEKIHLKIALNLTEEFRTAKWEGGVGDPLQDPRTYVIFIGESLAENVPVLARHTFMEVVATNNGSLPMSSVDALLTPKLVYINRTYFGKPVTSIKLEWSLSDSAGNVLWVDTITGEGTGNPNWAQAALKTALEQVLLKSQRAMLGSQVILKYVAKKYPDAQIIDTVVHIGDSQIEDLCAVLESDNPDEVGRSLKLLRNMHAPEAVPRILPCLKSSNSNVVRDACRTLAILGNKNVIPSIEPLLKHSRKDVRKDAQDAIDKLKAK